MQGRWRMKELNKHVSQNGVDLRSKRITFIILGIQRFNRLAFGCDSYLDQSDIKQLFNIKFNVRKIINNPVIYSKKSSVALLEQNCNWVLSMANRIKSKTL